MSATDIKSYLDRIATFQEFSISNNRISLLKAAKANFRFKPQEAAAVCDKCNAKITFWEDNVDPFEMHRTTCQYLRDYQSSKIIEIRKKITNSNEILSDFNKNAQQKNQLSIPSSAKNIVDSYKKFPLSPELKRYLIEANFWYTNVGDTVICPDCNLIEKNWDCNRKPINVHHNESPNCSFILKKYEDRDCPKFNTKLDFDRDFSSINNLYVPGLTAAKLLEIKEDKTLSDSLDDLDQEPKNKDMIQFLKRKESMNSLKFSNNYKTELASGGFYSSDAGHILKCFHCAVELRTHDESVNPTIFHAIWFPLCAYIIRRCGCDIVKKLGSLPLIDREGSIDKKVVRDTAFSNIDPREARARMDTPIVQLIVQQGHNWNTILRAIEIFMRRNGDDFTTATELIEVVKELEEKACKERALMPDTVPDNAPSPLPDTPPKTERDYKERNDAIRQARRCKNIKSDGNRCEEISNIVTLPCGCLGLCEFCADSVVYCKRCKHIIRGTVKIFRS